MLRELAPKLRRDHILVMNMCGRGDKDLAAVLGHLAKRGRPV